MPIMINIADLPDPDDPAGRSYRQVNLAKKHDVPIGTLVEIVAPPGLEDFEVEDYRYEVGVRLFVVAHTRDCDGTPLYSLSVSKDPEATTNYHRVKWHCGYSRENFEPV